MSKTIFKQRDYYWDYVRAVAIIAVIFIHTINPMLCSPFGMIFRQFIIFPVFTFFVLAGYFTHYTIGKTSYKNFITRKIIRLLPTLLLFSVMMAIVKLYFWKSYDLESLLKALLSLPLGFGYFVIGLLQCFILIPFILRISKEWLRCAVVLIFNLISIAFMYWLIFNNPLRTGVPVPMPYIFFTCWIFPFYLGNLLYRNYELVDKIKKYRRFFLLLFIMSSGVAIAESMYFKDGYRLISCAQLKLSTFIQSTCLIMVFFGYHRTISKSRMVCRLGQASFFVYLSHWFLIIILRKVFTFFPSCPQFSSMWIISFSVIGGEVTAVYIMNKLNIKWLNKLIGIN